MSLQKPQHCGQNWLDMKPNPGGHLCGKCQKTIVDFSKMKWAEIEEMQKAHGNTLCGMYSSRQLDHWGHEAPRVNPSRIFATTALIVSLATASQASAQEHTDSTSKTIITGTVRDKNTEESLFGTSIYLKGTSIGTVADIDGNYKIDLTQYRIDTMQNPTLVFLFVGYKSFEYKLKANSIVEVNPLLEMGDVNVYTFRVNMPTRWDKAKRKIWDWFAPESK